jgi:hypothetical protein
VTVTDPSATVDRETQVLIEEARQHQRRRHLWIGTILMAALVIGLGVFLTVASSGTRVAPVSPVRRGGPVLAGDTGLHLDVFVGRTAYALNLDTGEVRSAVALPYDDLPTSPDGYGFGPADLEYIATAGGIFLPESARGGYVVSDDLQSVHPLSITSRRLPRGSTSRWEPGVAPDTLIAVTEIERTDSGGKASLVSATEREVTTKGKVLFTRALRLPSTTVPPTGEGAPISQTTDGLIVMQGSGGPGGSPLELVDQENGSVVRSPGYGGDAVASGDHLVWFGTTEPGTKNAPSASPDALHITDLRTGADTVFPGPSGFTPTIFVVSPDGTKVAAEWGSVNGNAASLGIVDLQTGAMKLVPDSTHASALVWAPSSRWLFFQTQGPGVGFGISAYKTGASSAAPLSLPRYVHATATVTIDGHRIPSLSEFHAFTLW